MSAAVDFVRHFDARFVALAEATCVVGMSDAAA
jgi:hypothetical protein